MVDLKSWLTGYALGLSGKPLPISKQEPIAYLYNGAQLPALPELPYEYAMIEYYDYPEDIDGGGQTARLICSSEPIFRIVLGGSYKVLGDVRYYYFNTNEALWSSRFGVDEPYPPINEWVMAGEEHFDGRTDIGSTPPAAELTWSNHDILVNGVQGAVTLSASDPIPVYE